MRRGLGEATTAGVLDEVIAAVALELLGLALGHEGADGLGGVLERGVCGVDLDLGEDGGHAARDAAALHLLAQGVLQVVADVALAHGATDGQRARDVLLRVGAGELGHGVGNHAHLRAVAVDDDDLVALLDEVNDGAGGVLDRLHLLRKVLAKGVSAEGDDDALAHGAISPLAPASPVAALLLQCLIFGEKHVLLTRKNTRTRPQARAFGRARGAISLGPRPGWN